MNYDLSFIGTRLIAYHQFCYLLVDSDDHSQYCSDLPSRSVPPWAPEVVAPSAQWNAGSSISLLPGLPQLQSRELSVVAPSVWNGLPLAQRFLPGFILTHSTLASKLLVLAVQRSGAFLSDNLKRRCINLRSE